MIMTATHGHGWDRATPVALMVLLEFSGPRAPALSEVEGSSALMSALEARGPMTC